MFTPPLMGLERSKLRNMPKGDTIMNVRDYCGRED
jgi:hypothetical protein